MKNSCSLLSAAIKDFQKKDFSEDFNLLGEGIESKEHHSL